jgi:hypothetical protein
MNCGEAVAEQPMNPSHPRVQRRLASLRASFAKSARQQREKHERELQDAGEIGRTHNLGEVVGIYAEKRRDVGGWGIFLFMLILLCGISGVGMLGQQLLKSLPPAEHDLGVAINVGLFLGLAALLIFAVWLARRPPRYGWLYVYTEGFFVAQQKANLPDTVRWEDVDSLYTVWKNNFDPASEDSTPRFIAYRVLLTDQRELTIPFSYRSMLDPYAPLGPLFASILPTPVAETLPQYPSIDQALQEPITQRKLPAATQAFHAGHPVEFGPLRLDWLGLTLDQGAKTLAWNEVKSVTADRDTLVVRQKERGSAWATLPLNDLPDVFVLFSLLKQSGIGQYGRP